MPVNETGANPDDEQEPRPTTAAETDGDDTDGASSADEPETA
jgi:hypothetical protein